MKPAPIVLAFCLLGFGVSTALLDDLKAEDEADDDIFRLNVIGVVVNTTSSTTVADDVNATSNVTEQDVTAIATTTTTTEKPKVIAKEEKKKDFIDLYESGKKAYLANDFKTCVADLENAIKAYDMYNGAILRCKLECKSEREKSGGQSVLAGDLDHMRFYEGLIRQTLCLMNCKNSTIPEMTTQLPKDVVDDFEWKVPFDFLQLCYYQSGDLKAAADAAFTYLVHNPDSAIMKDNVNWYANKLNNPKAEFVNRQPFLHSKAFKTGIEHYNEHEWDKSIEMFEQAAADFYTAEEECRAECEKPFDMGWYPDFVTSVANHYVFCLKCKQRCQQKLSNVDGAVVENIVPLMYNYLQFSYYKAGDIPKAVRCVETFLLFQPDDETMNRNKLYYQTNEKAEVSWFESLPEARKYFERDSAEKKLLDFIYAEFAFYNTAKKDAVVPSDVILAGEQETSKKAKGDLSLLD